MKRFVLSVILVVMAFAGYAQQASPAATASGKIGDTEVTIKYSQPAVKGRKIWGDLVPYNEVWRTGANKASTIEFSKDVMIEGKALKAGKYAIFTLPTDKDWTIIFSKKADQFGAFGYKEADDALRVKVATKKAAAMTERMTFAVGKSGVSLTWDNLEVDFSVK